MDQVALEQLGTARKLTIANTSTTLIADAANKDEIKARVAQIKKELSETDSGAPLAMRRSGARRAGVLRGGRASPSLHPASPPCPPRPPAAQCTTPRS